MGQISSTSRLPKNDERCAYQLVCALMRTKPQLGDSLTDNALHSIWRSMHDTDTGTHISDGTIDPLRGFAVPSLQWKAFGFQNQNPLSDVRGGGLLALQLLAIWARHSCVARAIARRNQAQSQEGRYYPPMAAGVAVVVQLVALFRGPTEERERVPYWPFVFDLCSGELLALVMAAIDERFVEAGGTYMDYPQLSRGVLGALPGHMEAVCAAAPAPLQSPPAAEHATRMAALARYGGYFVRQANAGWPNAGATWNGTPGLAGRCGIL